MKRQAGGELLRAVIVETEAYCQSEPAFKNSTNFQGPCAEGKDLFLPHSPYPLDNETNFHREKGASLSPTP